ncbi:TPA: hypothetical protein N0F65_011589 [Lagenidium giganteum]|uniref:beta-glucosidase n=1 Tax=Lagenidium giganteum TaxID=4803 RepID=A0AAV2ZFK7_9STRA|nr:TPA: hypothetical protein N0F65_011589 [Lagenidium giganteum]
MLTVREKVAQMTQLDIYSMMNGDIRDPATALNKSIAIAYAKAGVGSILNCPFPGPTDGRIGWTAADWRQILGQIEDIYKQHAKVPMIYGIDTIHGATYVRGATLFGQPISAAASFNPELVFKMGEIEAKDTYSAGIPWVFSPVLGIAVQPLWSRVYETFGEDPHLAAVMGSSIIRGIQQSGKVAACMKHFIGYSNPTSGLDRSDSVVSDWDLVNYYAPSFLAAVQAGVDTAMEAYISINGEPVIASRKMLVDLLRKDMCFDGMLISDYAEIDRMYYEHHLVPNVPEAVRVSLTHTSLDMNMRPYPDAFFDTVEKLVAKGTVPESRLDSSVRRILTLKKKVGLLGTQSRTEFTMSRESHEPGNDKDQRVALELAREGIVLLSNANQTLPLNQHPVSTGKRQIFLTGPTSDNKGYMCGGWSVFWQGSSNSSHFPNGKTLKEAMQQQPGPWTVTHKEVVDVDGAFNKQDWDSALAIAAESEYTIVAIGEGNYAEKSGDIEDLTLARGQLDYIRALAGITATKVVVVIISGRPRLLEDAMDNVHAVIAAFLPCEQGGQAIADILFGRTNPSGKLPITYPKSSGRILPYFHRSNTVCEPWRECDVHWRFGHGLSYSTFAYSDLILNTTRVEPDGVLQVGVTVTNTGPYDGKEAVLLFLSQKFRLASVPEARMLKQFKKVFIKSGESANIQFQLSTADWGYYSPQIGHGFHRQVEAGEYIVEILVPFPAPAQSSTTKQSLKGHKVEKTHAYNGLPWWRSSANATDGTARAQTSDVAPPWLSATFQVLRPLS